MTFLPEIACAPFFEGYEYEEKSWFEVAVK